MQKIQKLLDILEDKGYIKIKMNPEWGYKIIKCEQESIVDKIKTYLKDINERDYFYHISGKNIRIFNTRDFIEKFDKEILKGKERSDFFDWDKINGPKLDICKKKCIEILTQKGYTFEISKYTSRYICNNTIRKAERLKREKERKAEIDEFINNLQI